MSAPGPSGRTRARRMALEVVVALYDGKRSHVGVVRNLSEGGAFVAVDPPLPYQTGVSFWLPLGGQKLMVQGHVRWTRSLPAADGQPVGCGVEFYDPDLALAKSLGAILDALPRPG